MLSIAISDVYRIILENVVPLPEVGDDNKMVNSDIDFEINEAS